MPSLPTSDQPGQTADARRKKLPRLRGPSNQGEPSAQPEPSGNVHPPPHRARTTRWLQAHAGQQRAVAKLALEALGGAGLDALFQSALRTVAETLGLPVSRVFEHVSARRKLVVRACSSEPGPRKGTGGFADGPQSAAGAVLRTGEPVLVRHVREDPRFRPAPWLLSGGAVSGLNVPIGGNDGPPPFYGVLAAYGRKKRDFTPEEISFVQSLADVLAAAVAQRRREDALRIVEARHLRIAANTPGMVYQFCQRTDGSFTLPFVSEGSRQIFGLEPQAIYDQPRCLVGRIHPDERQGLRDAIQRSHATLVPMQWEGRQVLSDGTVRWLRVDSRPERLSNGDVLCDGIITDITSHKQAEEALRRSEERFRLANLHAPFPVMLHAPFPVMLHAEDGEVLQVNDAWTHLTGYPPEALGTMEDWLQRAYPAPEHQALVRTFLKNLSQHVGSVDCKNNAVRCASGVERIWDFKCANLGRLPDGRWLHISTATDVTERHEAEVALRQAKEEAERANRAKSEFLSRMSHELRTPLNAILGFGQLLELNPANAPDQPSVQQILRGGRHLLTLIDEVLDLTRVEAGDLALKPTAVSLQKLALDCVSFVSRMATARGITCSVEVGPACRTPVRADEGRLRQVLLNLLSNAIKYNREDGRVTLSCQAAPADRVRLRVADTGSGITPEGLNRLFTPFERLGQEQGEVTGTGLGLTVSKRLMEAMGGGLGVESQPGEGSTFWVELPLADNELPASVPPGEVFSRPARMGADIPSLLTLLYIEDNRSNVQLLETVLTRLRPQWRLLSASEGKSGLEQARTHHPGVILLDLQLPGMSGDAVLRELRNDAETRQTPVLLLSADATAHSRERLLALGATDYFAKPFNIAALLDKLDAMLPTASQN